MRTLRKLKPGQKGTQELQARFGPSLLCIRYRYDEATRERLKTVELVVQRRPPRSESCGPRRLRRQATGAAVRTVALRTGWRERDLQSRIKLAEGRWDRRRRVWILRRGMAKRLDYLHRVVGGGV